MGSKIWGEVSISVLFYGGVGNDISINVYTSLMLVNIKWKQYRETYHLTIIYIILTYRYLEIHLWFTYLL